MNRIFNLIWSTTRERWIVVSEKVKGNGKVPSSPLISLAVAAAMFASGGTAYALDPGALPAGGQITSGSGSIATSGSSMTVQQTSQQMIANWQSFNIGQNAAVRFSQPNAGAAALNRIADQNPSRIMGSLSANGQVFLINPSGIIFGKGSNVNVGGLVASTMSISDSDFNAGNYRFTRNGSKGSILNQGSITAADGGLVALLGATVQNEGIIEARLGSVMLASGETATLTMAGNSLYSVAVDPAAVATLIENSGIIHADGGTVVMRSSTADALLGSVINTSGVVRASNVAEKNGTIVLEGGTLLNSGTLDAGRSVTISSTGTFIDTGVTTAGDGTNGGAITANVRNLIAAGTWSAIGTASGGHIALNAIGTVEQVSGSSFRADGGFSGGTITLKAGTGLYLSGLLSASSTSGKGGEITITAPQTVVAGAAIHADGGTGGGRIRIGGGWQGKDSDVTNASTTVITAPSVITANAASQGDGGTVVAWSESSTAVAGRIEADGGASGGNGGRVEVSSHDLLTWGGAISAATHGGARGTILFDPKNITIDTAGSSTPFSVIPLGGFTAGSGTQTGSGGTLELPNGNIVVASSFDDTVATDAGAVRLYKPDGTLLSTFTGTNANDRVGTYLVALTNNGQNTGNFVVASPHWKNGASTNAGAVTWFDGTAQVTGTVTSLNSLVGTQVDDQVGGSTYTNTIATPNLTYEYSAVAPLTNGNYVVMSYLWNNGTSTAAGAATWCDGSNGFIANSSSRGGAVTSLNSLVGTKVDEMVGWTVPLTNGNYVVISTWANGTAAAAGAATWGDGSTGGTRLVGAITSLNSLVGTQTNDNVGWYGALALTNGNYVVLSPNWANGTVAAVGSATWCDGSNGFIANSSSRGGTITSLNSLVGTQKDDQVGTGGISLTNGNFVVCSGYWANGTLANAGAATWGDGSTGGTRLVGTISSTNSLVGTQKNDEVGGWGDALTNGNYVVESTAWHNNGTSTATALGAVTWVDGSNGYIANSSSKGGVVSSTNSLVGERAGDRIGYYVTPLTNGNYVVDSLYWQNPAGSKTWAGAATWGDGSTVGTRLVGTISSTNSLVGTQTSDLVGYGVTALANGNYVVSSFCWHNTSNVSVGAVTWVDGSNGYIANSSSKGGTVSSTNSLVGDQRADYVGAGAVWNRHYNGGNSGNGVYALSNGNYVVLSTYWHGDGTLDPYYGWPELVTPHGAVTWGDGSTGGTRLTGVVSSENSIVGATAGDMLGYGGLTVLTVGSLKDSIVLSSPYWSSDGTMANNAGRVDILTPAAPGQGYAVSPASDNTFRPSQITAILNAGADLVLQASNDITVNSAITANNPSGNGGALTLQAGRSILLNASIVTDNGNLTLIANDNASNGVVDAWRNAGAATITMAAGAAINAATGIVDIELRAGTGKTYATSGDITLGSITAGSIKAMNLGTTAGSGITLDGALTASGTGTAIELSGQDFTNNFGATALSTFSGRWLVWSGDPSSDRNGGLVNDFTQYDAARGTSTVLGSGNGFLYTTAPTIIVSLTGGVGKTYDGSGNATLSAGNYSYIGNINGDTVVLNNPTAGSYNSKEVATGKTVTVSGLSINSASNGSATVYGYRLAATAASADIGTITKKELMLDGVVVPGKVYDATTAATISGSIIGVVAGDEGVVSFIGGGSFSDRNVGTGKSVLAELSLVGTGAGNYSLTQPTGLFADITRANLTVTGLTAQSKFYDTTTAASLRGTASVSPFIGDSVTLGGTPTGSFANRFSGFAKPVTVTGNTLGGRDAGNYRLVQAQGLTANIYPLESSGAVVNVSAPQLQSTTSDSQNSTSQGWSPSLQGWNNFAQLGELKVSYSSLTSFTLQ